MLRTTRPLYPPVAPAAEQRSSATVAAEEVAERGSAENSAPCPRALSTDEVDFFAGKPASYQYGTILRPSPHLAAKAMSTLHAVPNVSSSANAAADEAAAHLSCSTDLTTQDAFWSRLRDPNRTATEENEASQVLRLQQLIAVCLETAREEAIARHDLTRDALCRLEGLYAWCLDGVEEDARRTRDKRDPLASLECRLSARRAAADAAQLCAERACREEGRREWQRAVAQQVASGTQKVVRAETNKCDDDAFRAATVFLIVEERKRRASLETSAEEAYTTLMDSETAARTEAARLAYERFMNAPEQLAITAALQRRVNTLRKRWAKHEAEQAELVNGCHHGTGGQSVFSGAHSRKICARCRVRFDEALGFYVRLDRPLPVPLPSLQKAIEEMGAKCLPRAWAIANTTKTTAEGRGSRRRSVGSKPSSATAHSRAEAPPLAARSVSAKGKTTSRLPSLQPTKTTGRKAERAEVPHATKTRQQSRM